MDDGRVGHGGVFILKRNGRAEQNGVFEFTWAQERLRYGMLFVGGDDDLLALSMAGLDIRRTQHGARWRVYGAG